MKMNEKSYENFVLVTYLTRLIEKIKPRSVVARVLTDWIKENEGLLEIDLSGFGEAKHSKAGKEVSRSRSQISDAQWKALRRALNARARYLANAKPGLFERNLKALASLLELSEIELAILEVTARYETSGPIEALFDRLIGTRALNSDSIIATLLDLPLHEVLPYLNGSGLRSKGVIYKDDSTRSPYFHYNIPYTLQMALNPPSDGKADIEKALLGKPLGPRLEWNDFEHISGPRDFLKALLRGASGTSAQGVNILIYGPPGTGKTEFCKALADRCGLTLHAVGESPDSSYELSRDDRLSALKVGQRVAAHNGGKLLLFDEMEDVLQSGKYGRCKQGVYIRAGSKVFINRLMEENNTPTIWTTNSIENFDPALLRRMSFSLEMRLPPTKVRARVWKRLLSEHSCEITEPEVDALARRFEIAPGLAATALRSTELAGGGTTELTAALEAMDKAVSWGRVTQRQTTAAHSFEESLVSADTNLRDLTTRLSRPAAPRDVSFCLYGPPGTGKSAYLRHLAGAMGLEVMQKRTSDLLSKWVGQSERNIAEAFSEARDSEQFLIFDEADSLLWDRGRARQSFEISQVNEMLTWMESHDWPFACTTNLMEGVDRAALRRFIFKVKFDYLTAAQARQAFETFFGCKGPADLDRLTCLTPGDFALAARKRRHLGEDLDPGALLELLEQEAALKPGQTQKMGFHMSA